MDADSSAQDEDLEDDESLPKLFTVLDDIAAAERKYVETARRLDEVGQGVLLLIFGGRGKIAAVMGDFAKGITSFRKGLKDDEQEEAADAGDAPAIDRETTESDNEKSGS